MFKFNHLASCYKVAGLRRDGNLPDTPPQNVWTKLINSLLLQQQLLLCWLRKFNGSTFSFWLLPLAFALALSLFWRHFMLRGYQDV